MLPMTRLISILAITLFAVSPALAQDGPGSKRAMKVKGKQTGKKTTKAGSIKAKIKASSAGKRAAALLGAKKVPVLQFRKGADRAKALKTFEQALKNPAVQQKLRSNKMLAAAAARFGKMNEADKMNLFDPSSQKVAMGALVVTVVSLVVTFATGYSSDLASGMNAAFDIKPAQRDYLNRVKPDMKAMDGLLKTQQIKVQKY